MFNIGPGEMMLLGLLALLLFGPKRLPELGRALGEGLAAFRQTSRGVAEEFKRQLDEGAREIEPEASPPGIPMTAPEAEEDPETVGEEEPAAVETETAKTEQPVPAA